MLPQLATIDTNEFGGPRAAQPFHQHRSAGFDGVRPAWAANGADHGRRSVSISTVISEAGNQISIIERDILMLKVFKTDIERLEQTAAKAKADLHKIAAQREEAASRAAALAGQVAEAFASDLQNASDLEEQHVRAELRARSLAGAEQTAQSRLANAEQALADAKAKAKAEASAAAARKLADDLEKSKPVAAKATRQVAEIWGSVPASGPWSTTVIQSFDHWTVGATDFFEGDFVDIAVKELRQYADDILAGRRSSDLGPSFDAQAISYGRKPIGGLKKAS